MPFDAKCCDLDTVLCLGVVEGGRLSDLGGSPHDDGFLLLYPAVLAQLGDEHLPPAVDHGRLWDLVDVPDPPDRGPLRLRSERRCKETAGRRQDERPPVHHSITWSARISSDCGIATPRALACLPLLTSSNLVGCSTGRSAGFA